jgi:hypothetical protein
MATASRQFEALDSVAGEASWGRELRRRRLLWTVTALLFLGGVLLLGRTYWAPVCHGRVESVFAVPVAANPSVFALVQISVNNTGTTPVVIQGAEVTVKSGGNRYTGKAMERIDFERYTQAYPPLYQHAGDVIAAGSTIEPGATLNGFVLVELPVAMPEFERRSSLAVAVTLQQEHTLRFRQ